MIKKSVTIVDYGMGNIMSLSRALEFCGAQVELANTPKGIKIAERLILPGVGAFQEGARGLRERKLLESIQNYFESGKPFLGICLGMQMLLKQSYEFGLSQGLGYFDGSVRLLPTESNDDRKNILPHVSWNTIEKPVANENCWNSSILEDVDPGFYAYFVHSYYCDVSNQENILAVTPFNDFIFPSIIRKNNVYGAQFHPEKSGKAGLNFLEKFLSL